MPNFAQVQSGLNQRIHYLAFNWKIMTDTTMAAGTGLLNLATLSWDKNLLKQIMA